MAIADPRLAGLTPEARRAQLVGDLRTRLAVQERNSGGGSGTTAAVADATTTSKGKVQLAGDLSGTADAPTVAADAITTTKIDDGAVTVAKLDPAAHLPNLVNSKGDIFVATASGVVAKLDAPAMDGSADGWVLTVDSTTATGLAWVAVPGVPSVVWAVVDYVTDRTYNANATTLNELVDVFGTLVMLDLTGAPPLGGTYTITNSASDKVLDANSCTIHELADVLATAIGDLDAGTGAGTYTVTNYIERRDLDGDIATLHQLADCLCTLITDEGLA